MADPYPPEPTGPPAVKVDGSSRVHAATVMVPGNVMFPACGYSLGRSARREPVHDPDLIDCDPCLVIAERKEPRS